MLRKKLHPRDVFTPRATDLNQKTYAERPELEKALESALEGQKYMILHGESGNGKTWLYKRVFQKLKVPYTVVNLARMITERSLNAVLSIKLGELGYREQVEEKQEADVGIRPGGMGGGYKHIYTYQDRQIGAIEAVGIQLSGMNKGKKCIIVLDNFEQISRKKEVVEQIAALIISADEEIVAKTGIKFLIVGTPSNIMEMMKNVSDSATISNRFVEIPEVTRLQLGESRYIMSEGFEQHLNCTFVIDKNQLYKDISLKTDGIAQQVQELCLKIAQEASNNNNIINRSVVDKAERLWLQQTLSSDQTAVITHMNSQETKVGRKNQAIYCLGHLKKEDFKQADVESLVRNTFAVPPEKNLNIPQILADFQKGSNPLIRKSPISNHYHFCSPKYKMDVSKNPRI